MNHVEIKKVANIRDTINFNYSSNGVKSEIYGVLACITLYDITVYVHTKDLYGYDISKTRDYSLQGITNLVNCNRDFDLGI